MTGSAYGSAAAYDAAAAYAAAAAYDLRGAERPGIVVALHGLGGTRAGALASLHGFDEPSFGILAPDLRGHGQTAFLGDERDFTPRQLAADVRSLLGLLGLEAKPTVVLGVSLGATVALELVRRRTLEVIGAVFIRPAHTSVPAPHLRVNALIAAYLREDPEHALERLLASDEYRAVAAISELGAASLRDKVTADRAQERALRLRAGARWTAFEPAERLEAPPPSLVVGARADPLHPLSVALEWHERIAGSRLVELPSRDADPEAYAASARATVQRFLADLAPAVMAPG